MQRKNLLAKPEWKNALGAASKPRRLNLEADFEGLFTCPLENCDSNPFYSKRGCRKHVYTKHGWYYYFDKKPEVAQVMPNKLCWKRQITKAKRSATCTMPSFSKGCKLAARFKKWLCSPGGGGKSIGQSEQNMCKSFKIP